jgi:hypothetical protein
MLAGGAGEDLNILLKTTISGLKILIEQDQKKLG